MLWKIRWVDENHFLIMYLLLFSTKYELTPFCVMALIEFIKFN